MEDAFVYLHTSVRVGDSVGGKIVAVLPCLPLLPDHDGAAPTEVGHLFHGFRVECGRKKKYFN